MPYNAAASGGSNLGPDQPGADRRGQRPHRRLLQAADPGNTLPIPVDLVTASGSGLDPDISPAAALYQVARVARERHMDAAPGAASSCSRTSQGPQWGLFGEPRVNVLDAQSRPGSRTIAHGCRPRPNIVPIRTSAGARSTQQDAARRGAASCGFISAPRPASARPTPCSRPRASCRARAATWWSASLETHGRAETAALLEGIELLPPKRVALPRHGSSRNSIWTPRSQRHPALILVDELAHTNVPGQRHPKRWQDVEELLSAGIDVFTTLNVQHLESLNDVVGGITNVRVWETVPDTVFDAADEVVLVDIPADELLARLKAGKVYVPQQAERAAKNFFRKGNLDGAARAGAAPHRRPSRGRRPGLSRRQIHRVGLEDRLGAVDLRRSRSPARSGGARRRAAGESAERRLARGLRGDARICSACRAAGAKRFWRRCISRRSWGRPPR